MPRHGLRGQQKLQGEMLHIAIINDVPLPLGSCIGLPEGNGQLRQPGGIPGQPLQIRQHGGLIIQHILILQAGHRCLQGGICLLQLLPELCIHLQLAARHGLEA